MRLTPNEGIVLLKKKNSVVFCYRVPRLSERVLTACPAVGTAPSRCNGPRFPSLRRSSHHRSNKCASRLMSSACPSGHTTPLTLMRTVSNPSINARCLCLTFNQDTGKPESLSMDAIGRVIFQSRCRRPAFH